MLLYLKNQYRIRIASANIFFETGHERFRHPAEQEQLRADPRAAVERAVGDAQPVRRRLAAAEHERRRAEDGASHQSPGSLERADWTTQI